MTDLKIKPNDILRNYKGQPFLIPESKLEKELAPEVFDNLAEAINKTEDDKAKTDMIDFLKEYRKPRVMTREVQVRDILDVVINTTPKCTPRQSWVLNKIGEKLESGKASMSLSKEERVILIECIHRMDEGVIKPGQKNRLIGLLDPMGDLTNV